MDVEQMEVEQTERADRDATVEEGYHYWIDDRGSHHLSAITDHLQRCLAEARTTPKRLFFTIRGYRFKFSESDVAKDVEQLLRERTFKDQALSSGDTRCAFTREPFEDPHILNLNGRTYSRAALDAAIKSTLAGGKPLRLEDGRTLMPSDLSAMTAYPNLSALRARPPPALKWEPPPRSVDVPEASLLRTLPGFWKALKQGRPKGDDHWDAPGAWEIYAAAFGVSQPSGHRVVEHLVVEDEDFSGIHAKSGDEDLRFVRCVFRRCKMWSCGCSTKHTRCLFVDCSWPRHGYYHFHCKQCTFVRPQLSQATIAQLDRSTNLVADVEPV